MVPDLPAHYEHPVPGLPILHNILDVSTGAGKPRGSKKSRFMINELLKKAFLKELPKLDCFFSHKLKSIKPLEVEEEATRKELIQLTFIRTWMTYERKLSKYTMEQIIWQAAHDVWYAALIRKKLTGLGTLSLTEEHDNREAPDENAHFEKKEMARLLLRRAKLTKEEYTIYELYLLGYSYTEMSTITGQPANALKQRVYNITKKIRGSL